MRISDWSSDVCSSDLINRFADRDDLLAQYTRDGGRNLDRDLVGFKADDRFVDRHRIARLFQPFADRRFGDAFAKGGNCNFGAHGVIPCGGSGLAGRSEEHTSELQSLMRISYAVFCLKKKKNKKQSTITH